MVRRVLLAAVLTACSDPSLHLSETEQLSVVISPITTDFGSVLKGSSSAPATITLSPAGTGESEDIVLGITACPNFTLDLPPLPAVVFRDCDGMIPEEPAPEQVAPFGCPQPSIRTVQFQATFNPTVQGTATCTGQIMFQGSMIKQGFNLKGTGILPDQDVDVAPATISFVDIRVGDVSTPRSVVVTNIGAKDLTLSAAFTTSNSQLKLQGGNTAIHALAPGNIDVFPVTCAPDADGAIYTAALDVSSDDPLQRTAHVTIVCNGIDSQLDINPDSVAFTSLVGKPDVVTLTLQNTGGGAGTVATATLVDLVGADLAITTPSIEGQTLNPNGSTQVTLQYTPSAGSLDQPLGSFKIMFAGDSEREVTISGSAKTATVGAEPNILDFGPVCSGISTVGQVDVFAAADGVFDVLGSSTAAPFSVAETTVAFTLEPLNANHQRFHVTLDPPSGIVPAGELSADVTGTLQVLTTAPNQETFPIELHGQALREGITALPEDLAVGAIEVSKVTAAQTVTFTNCSGASVMVTDERITGRDAGDFLLTHAFQPTLIDNAKTIPIDVQLSPQAIGDREAELVIDYTGGTATIRLFGDGIGTPDVRDTYYACSTGGSARCWPIVLAIVIVIMRRKRRRPCRQRTHADAN